MMTLSNNSKWQRAKQNYRKGRIKHKKICSSHKNFRGNTSSASSEICAGLKKGGLSRFNENSLKFERPTYVLQLSGLLTIWSTLIATCTTCFKIKRTPHFIHNVSFDSENKLPLCADTAVTACPVQQRLQQASELTATDTSHKPRWMVIELKWVFKYLLHQVRASDLISVWNTPQFWTNTASYVAKRSPNDFTH
jgi:hypothetical protein